MRLTLCSVLIVLVSSVRPSFAQTSVPVDRWARQASATFLPVARTVDLSGPRIGFTQLTPKIVDRLKERNIDVGTSISQFGWQFERQFYTR